MADCCITSDHAHDLPPPDVVVVGGCGKMFPLLNYYGQQRRRQRTNGVINCAKELITRQLNCICFIVEVTSTAILRKSVYSIINHTIKFLINLLLFFYFLCIWWFSENWSFYISIVILFCPHPKHVLMR